MKNLFTIIIIVIFCLTIFTGQAYAKVTAHVTGTSVNGRYEEVDKNGSPTLNMNHNVYAIIQGSSKMMMKVTVELYDFNGKFLEKESGRFGVKKGRYEKLSFYYEPAKDRLFIGRIKIIFGNKVIKDTKVRLAIPN